ncbi:imidazoleglycerol phosphate dehydratase [Trichophyton tonsurans CBS 112818]|uniref:Imidazoleglycerol-phosphate dehydratase n=1 Tax=Trichophyton tonsurans (strain CBS 112818) TaxID=647933 RepID=F2RML4_TRIT1|nr:imidazoleglycerol phosphate dehydratase [Trichophyton tonsurans CBS 112818]
MAALRSSYVERFTKETKTQISLCIDGGPLDVLPDSHKAFESSSIPNQKEEHHACQFSATQHIWIWTGVGFLDHMLHALAKHGGWSLRIRTVGDLAIDDHHTTEDTFLALGEALLTALGDRKGIKRFGSAYAPLDEALARAVIDISSRPFFVGVFDFKDAKIGNLTSQMIPHGLQSFAHTAGVTLHVDVLKGENDHHRAEAAFKALAVAIRDATSRVAGKEGEVISTKGIL